MPIKFWNVKTLSETLFCKVAVKTWGQGGWAKASQPPCLPSLSPFVISLLGCSWRPLPHCLPSLSPFMVSLLGGSWLPLPPCLPSLSPFKISILGCFWLPPPPCLPRLSPFMISLSGLLLAAPVALSPKLVSLHDFPSGLSPLGISLLGCLIALVKMRCRPPPKNKVQWPRSPRAMACCCASSYSCSSCVSCHSASSLAWATLLRVWPSGGFEARGLKILRSWQG